MTGQNYAKTILQTLSDTMDKVEALDRRVSDTR
jgi:hypothetical protein